jgi:hypothetical protein
MCKSCAQDTDNILGGLWSIGELSHGWFWVEFFARINGLFSARFVDLLHIFVPRLFGLFLSANTQFSAVSTAPTISSTNLNLLLSN